MSEHKKPKPEQPAEKEPEVPKRRAKVLMVNAADFMFLFTEGLEFRKHTKIFTGVPDDAKLLGLAPEPIRNGVMMVVESQSYDEIPITEQPPIQLVEIKTGQPGATKKKKSPRKK